MSKIVKLLAVSLLLTGCAKMYGDADSKKHTTSESPDKVVTKHVITHNNNITSEIAARASAATIAADKLNPNTP